jgi:erythromycin esterase-like protein
MWRNVEVHDFVDWLRAHNESRDAARRASAGYTRCEIAVVTMLRDLFERELAYERRDGESFFDACTECAARCLGGALLPGHVSWGGRVLESA